MKSKAFIFLLLSIGWTSVGAQSFKYQAELGNVSANGFYKIALTPQIISKTESFDLADIRIFEKDKEIAYLIRKIADSIYIKDTTGLQLQHYTLIPTPSISVKEDKANQRSIIQIRFNAGYQIDKMILNLEGFRYYRRTAWLTETNPLIKKKKDRYSEDRLANFIISSGKQPVIDLCEQNRYKQLFLIIENEESEALLIKNIKAYQKNMELITYLEKDKPYVIKAGKLNMQLPRYDLRYFSDSISSSIPFINVLNFKISKDEPLVKDSVSIKKSWMWIAIGLLILFLGYLSYFMVKDMQRNK
ncbi:hypothetical protein [Pedobacter nyackensis]|uniref:DUF3999 family protein n=1 Tax=Pedobacter nyackensis TaxID=475255 RepID=A0A1W2CQ95_9SPHI|nr:hypothetical protein [Pedobacter nyackensis]SMC87042.1 hypothetical protein SAMN04488101_10464 [Pedobacter nyackensis]